MFGHLMFSRRFAPLFWCQFLSAFNDNFVRQMLVMMILFGRVYGAAMATIIFAICTATKLPFMQSIVFTVAMVAVQALSFSGRFSVTVATRSLTA